jgi:hypothetical protein
MREVLIIQKINFCGDFCCQGFLSQTRDCRYFLHQLTHFFLLLLALPGWGSRHPSNPSSPDLCIIPQEFLLGAFYPSTSSL